MKGSALAVALAVLALAQIAFDTGTARAVIPGASLEVEAYDLYNNEKYLTARARAEVALRNDPNSMVGHYVLGSVLREAEGSLPRALSHLREARRLFEVRYGAGPEIIAPVRSLYGDILLGLENTAGLMERYEEQLEALRAYDALDEPKVTGLQAWPLMKLQRFDEAREVARRAAESEGSWHKSVGLNALCAIEGEAHRRQASYEHCVAALEHAKARVAEGEARGDQVLPSVAVHARNAAEAALASLRLADAERLALEGTRRMERSVSNPWRLLMQLELDEGRAGDAVAATRQMQAWCAHQPPGSRDQKAAEIDAAIATLLLVAGEAGAGLRFITRALERPDRHGISSARPEQALGGHALVRHDLRKLDSELERERASTLGLTARAARLAASMATRAAVLADEERVIQVLADDRRLEYTLRPRLDGGLDDVPVWLIGDLVGVLGPGVVAVGLARARAADELSATMPYFDALEAEVALARGEASAAFTRARGAFNTLPPAEVLLRARTAAIAAEAAHQAGDEASSVVYFQRALELDPGILRRLGLALPATIRVETPSEDAARVATLLEGSPRWRPTAGGFEVRIGQATTGTGLRVCLVAPFGASLGCATSLPVAGEAPATFASRLASELHRVVFTLRLPLTEIDVRSLDGSTIIARDAGREQLRGILEAAPDFGEK